MLEKSLEKVDDLKVTFHEWDVEVHWDITMRCNYSCRYCESYDNNVPLIFKTLDEYKKSLDYIKQFLDCKKPRLVLLGGEPTLFKDWVELLEYAISLGFKPELTTNLSVGINYLKKHMTKIKKPIIDVSWHPSFVKDTKELLDKIKFLEDNNCLKGVSIMGDTAYWKDVEYAVSNLQYIKDKLSVSMIYDEKPESLEIRGDSWTYTPEQKKFMFDNSSPVRLKWDMFINNRIESKAEKYLEEHSLLNFKGMYCAVGQKRITIKPNGDVYPSVCLMNYDKAKMGNVFKQDLKKPTKPLKCPFSICSCGPDIRIEKHRDDSKFKAQV